MEIYFCLELAEAAADMAHAQPAVAVLDTVMEVPHSQPEEEEGGSFRLEQGVAMEVRPEKPDNPALPV